MYDKGAKYVLMFSYYTLKLLSGQGNKRLKNSFLMIIIHV
jgi:hypothetical protein